MHTKILRWFIRYSYAHKYNITYLCVFAGAASVARAWSGFFDSMFDNVIRNTTVSVLGELHETLLGKYPDVFAFFVCLLHACILGWYDG